MQPRITPIAKTTMEAYLYECASADFEELARVISDLFPEQTRFVQQAATDGGPSLSIQWTAMRFGPAAKRIVMQVRVAPDALARYRATPPRARGRSFAVLRAYVEAMLGSLEEQHAKGDEVPREVTIELADEFA